MSSTISAQHQETHITEDYFTTTIGLFHGLTIDHRTYVGGITLQPSYHAARHRLRLALTVRPYYHAASYDYSMGLTATIRVAALLRHLDQAHRLSIPVGGIYVSFHHLWDTHQQPYVGISATLEVLQKMAYSISLHRQIHHSQWHLTFTTSTTIHH